MKKAIVFIMLGILIGATGTVAASTETVQAIFADFKIIVNDKEVKLENKALVHDGITYLPIRDMSHLLGYDVTYIDATKSILFKRSKTEGEYAEWASLESLKTQYSLKTEKMKASGDSRISKEGQIWFDVPTHITKDGEVVVVSPKGLVRITNRDGEIFVNLKDLQLAGLTK